MLLALILSAIAAPVDGYIDCHNHPAAHRALWPIYRPGPTADLPRNPTWDHRLKQQMFVEGLKQSGTTIFLTTAYANPYVVYLRSRRSVARSIERQLRYVERFAEEHAGDFAHARTPEEARSAIAAGKIVFIHAIEGASNLIERPEHARRWADRGVAVITPIHMADNNLGDAAYSELFGRALNLRGRREVRRIARKGESARRYRGLSERGVAVITAMARAGIVIDLAHMDSTAVEETLDLLQPLGSPPMITHGAMDAIRQERRSTPDRVARRIYDAGGLIALAGNAEGLAPHPAEPPEGHCEGSVDDLLLHYEHLAAVIDNAPIAWGSDFHGGVVHFRPRYGPEGCAAAPEMASEFDTQGLTHVGMMPGVVDAIEQTGPGVTPLMGSAERFLTLWETARHSRAQKT